MRKKLNASAAPWIKRLLLETNDDGTRRFKSGRELAAALGVHEVTLSANKSGSRSPSDGLVLSICKLAKKTREQYETYSKEHS